jgi:hypothetical protein
MAFATETYGQYFLAPYHPRAYLCTPAKPVNHAFSL